MSDYNIDVSFFVYDLYEIIYLRYQHAEFRTPNLFFKLG